MNNSIFDLIIRNKKRIIIIIVALSIILIALFTDYGLIKRVKLEKQKKELSNRIINEKNIRDSLARQIEKLQIDTLEIERIAREFYGMTRPGEQIYYLQEDEDTLQ